MLAPAERGQLERRARHRLEIAAHALEDRRRPGHAARREHRREHRVAARVGVGAAFPHRDVADARLIERDVGRNAEVERLGDLLFRQTEQARRGRRARHAADGHVVEAERLEVHLVAHAAEHFVGEHGRGDQRPCRCAA